MELRVSQEALDLGTVDQTLAHALIVEGLDAKDVAGAHQALLLVIPDGEGKHTAQTLQHRNAPLLVAMQNGLGIALSLEVITASNELLAKLLIVIDLAVEGDDDAAILVFHRLAAALKVDDGQTTETHGDVIVHEVALVVGTAMNDAVGHVLDNGLIGWRVVIYSGKADESAHMPYPSLRTSA